MTNPSQEPWSCTGTTTNPHPKTDNSQETCQFPGCEMTRNSSSVPEKTGSRNKPALLGTIALLAIALLGVYSLFQRFTSSSPETGGGQSEESTSSTSTTDLLSSGELVFFKARANTDRDEGVKAFKAENYEEAVKSFEKAVLANPNDPETQIYLNNAKARLKGSLLVIATVVPVDNKQASAEEMLRGVADAQTQFNDEGGIDGQLVEILIANDGNDPELSAQIAKEIAVKPEVLGIIGHNSSDASEAGLAEYKKENIVMISPTSSSTSLSGKFLFRTVPSDEATGNTLAEYAKNELEVDEVAVFYTPNSSYSTSLQEAFEGNFKQLGGEVVDTIDMGDANLDPKAEVEALQGKVKAIALFPNTNLTSVAIALARTNLEQSGEKLLILGGDALYSSDTLIAGGEAVENMIMAVPWFAGSQDYAERAEKRWLGKVNWRTATSFDATQAMLAALSEGANRKSVLNNLKSLNLPKEETSGGQLQFSSEGERSQEPVLVKVAQGGSTPEGSKYGFMLIEP